MTQVINKVNITAEAVLEYEECLDERKRPSFDELLFMAEGDNAKAFELCEQFEGPFRKMDKRLFKQELEEYIDTQNRSGRLLHDRYFRCLWYDEGMDRMLMLFFYRRQKLSVMQYWDLMGIKLESEWSQEDEDDGMIRLWLKGKLDDDYKGDWVFDQIERAKADALIGGEAKTVSVDHLPKEMRNAIKYGSRDNEHSEELSVCETSSEEWARWSKAKNDARIHRMFNRGVK